MPPPFRAARALAGAILLGASLSACGIDFGGLMPPEKVSTSTRDAAEAARLISEYRRSHGLGPVSADSRLNAAAIHQARAVAQAGLLSHGDFSGRMGEYGIKGSAAENLTAGSTTVTAAIARWKNSPAHNSNLLLADASRIGLARADTPDQGYKHYWALVLAQ